MSLTKVTYSMIDGAVVNVKDFGATGDGVTDDTAAIQAALDYVASLGGSGIVPFRRSGGTLFFPNGTYKTTAPLEPLPGVYNIVGTGRFKNYPQVFTPSATGLPTIMPVHSGRNAMTLYSNNDQVSMRIFGLTFATLETGPMPTAAIGFRSGNEFQRDYTFDYVGIFGFTSAFDVYDTNGIQAKGIIKIWNCAINRNTHVFRCLDNDVVNVLLFQGNEAGENTNGMFVKGDVIVIEDNVFESNADAIEIFGTYRGLEIKKNYFEANGGDFVIKLNNTVGAVVENNFYNTITATNTIYCRYDVDTFVNEPLQVPVTDGSFNLKNPNQSSIAPLIGVYNTKAMSIAVPFDASRIRGRSSAYHGDEIGGLFINPTTTNLAKHVNIAGSVGYDSQTAGSGYSNWTATGLSINSGDWIGVGIICTYDDNIETLPILELLPNGTATYAYQAQFYNSNKSAIQVNKNTILYFAVNQAQEAVTSYDIIFYPFGSSVTAGLNFVSSAPYIINFGQDLPNNNTTGNLFPYGAIDPFIPEKFINTISSIPTTGTWEIGDTAMNRTPTAAGYLGWVCVTAGTPGTWKGAGLIET